MDPVILIAVSALLEAVLKIADYETAKDQLDLAAVRLANAVADDMEKGKFTSLPTVLAPPPPE